MLFFQQTTHITWYYYDSHYKYIFTLQRLKILWLLTLIVMPANKNQKPYIHPAFFLYKGAACTPELLLPLPDHFTGLIFPILDSLLLFPCPLVTVICAHIKCYYIFSWAHLKLFVTQLWLSWAINSVLDVGKGLLVHTWNSDAFTSTSKRALVITRVRFRYPGVIFCPYWNIWTMLHLLQ